jgi:hypothetical protein
VLSMLFNPSVVAPVLVCATCAQVLRAPRCSCTLCSSYELKAVQSTLAERVQFSGSIKDLERFGKMALEFDTNEASHVRVNNLNVSDLHVWQGQRPPRAQRWTLSSNVFQAASPSAGQGNRHGSLSRLCLASPTHATAAASPGTPEAGHTITMDDGMTLAVHSCSQSVFVMAPSPDNKAAC